jgi:hypothetical protein
MPGLNNGLMLRPMQPASAPANPLAGHPGLLTRGNIDLMRRPVVRNPDGTISTVRSMSVNFGGPEVLIPTVSDDGRILSEDDAIGLYKKSGKHLGMFQTPAHATAYAKWLHDQQAATYGKP